MTMTLNGFAYPEGLPRTVTDVVHGQEVADPFRWLEDATSVETRAWASAQQVLSRALLAGLPDSDTARDLMTALMAAGTGTPALRRGRWVFREMTDPLGEHPRLCASGPAGHDDHVLWDRSAMARWDPSPDGRTVALQSIEGGREDHTPLVLLDVPTGEITARMPHTRYSPIAWLADSSGFFYSRAAKRNGPQELWLRRHGTEHRILASSDDLCRFRVRLWHDRWLTVAIRRGSDLRNRLLLADIGPDPRRPVWSRIQDTAIATTVPHLTARGELFLATTYGAPAGRVVTADPYHCDPERWTTVVPEDAEAPLTHACLQEAPGTDVPQLLVARTRRGRPDVSVHFPGTGRPPRPVPLPGSGTVLSLDTDPGGPTHLGWTSWTTPPATYRVDPVSLALAGGPVRRHQDELHEWREETVSADGARIPLTLLRRRNGADGPSPTLLLGYGGFQQTLTSSYESLVLAWVESGGLVVVPELRGPTATGGKHATFEDLEATADHLRRQALTLPHQLGLLGMSNGGLTMAAATVRAPGRYGAVVCIAPLTDMVRYEHSGLGHAWRHEYGSAQDPDAFRHLLSYSPYHRITPGRPHPPTLLITLDGDTRVDPLHARKFCARLQHEAHGGGPYLWRTYRNSGHASMSRSARQQMACDILGFSAFHTGLRLASPTAR
ncbi:prolyl oligopeptidase family serine peptidase [Streptomyces caniferus]|uniref:prolyl oligopeptidase family serine peptidase n=1 Tax=Streptomyces caniferus TaxID=285557 RepID=UPI003452A97A